MRKNEKLAKVFEMEAELAECLLDVMEKKKDAIVRMQSDALADAVRREEELLEPLAELEQERVRIVRNIRIPKAQRTGKTEEPERILDLVLGTLPEDEAAELSSCASRLREAITRIANVNEQNKILLSHSRQFVRETLRILTDNYRRQLVDQKV
jgi:flagellar biosynthesis/type III secretory pathway chaperone